MRGDGEVKYARMMELMGELGQAGFARVTLVTDVVGESQAPSRREETEASQTSAVEAGAVSSPVSPEEK